MAMVLDADYMACSTKGTYPIVFKAITPRAHAIFKNLPTAKNGSFLASTDDEAFAYFDRLDDEGLIDFTLG